MQPILYTRGQALPALLEMMAKNNRSLPVALAAIGKLGNHKVLDKILHKATRAPSAGFSQGWAFLVLSASVATVGWFDAFAVPIYLYEDASIGQGTPEVYYGSHYVMVGRDYYDGYDEANAPTCFGEALPPGNASNVPVLDFYRIFMTNVAGQPDPTDVWVEVIEHVDPFSGGAPGSGFVRFRAVRLDRALPADGGDEARRRRHAQGDGDEHAPARDRGGMGARRHRRHVHLGTGAVAGAGQRQGADHLR